MNATDYDHFADLPDALDAIEVLPGHQLCHECLRQVTPERWDTKECACVECTHFDKLEQAADARELEAARQRLTSQSVITRAHKNQRRNRRGAGPDKGRS